MNGLFLLSLIALFAPLAAFVTNVLLPSRSQKLAPTFSVIAALMAWVAAWLLLAQGLVSDFQARQWSAPWLLWSDASIHVGILLDRLNLLMLFIVTSISFWVQLFSVSYMHDDSSRRRYFAFLSLFSFAMTGLVLSPNLVETFLFWELVGLSSYLLIGFWYQKPEAAQAGRKAFVINRLADLGFYLALLLLLLLVGSADLEILNAPEITQFLSPAWLTLIALLVFMGVMGKSAQFPMHVWLPDAMEGPTPVSALIHSATMVAAGVFLTARLFPFFSHSATAMNVILIFGSITTLIAATQAVVQNDIKRILAYSTVSQLGLMLMGLGAGSLAAGMFHLTTHAYFKSLLFLAAGALIHHFHTNDIWEMSRQGSAQQRLTLTTLWVGALSLAAVPGFAGFWSKDIIMETLYHRPVFYAVGVLVSFLTSYYTFRMGLVLSAQPASMGPAHHEPASMRLEFCLKAPLVILAIGALAIGLGGSPLAGGTVMRWWDPSVRVHFNFGAAAWPLAAVVLGGAAAWLNYRHAVGPAMRRQWWRQILESRYYLDDLWAFVVKQIALRLAAFFHVFDRAVVNGLMVNGTARMTYRFGEIFSRLQNGLLQNYLWLTMAAVVLFLTFFLRQSGAGS